VKKLSVKNSAGEFEVIGCGGQTWQTTCLLRGGLSMAFRLAKPSANKSITKFVVYDEESSIIGSISVPNERADELVRSFSGLQGPANSPQPRQQFSPQTTLAQAFLRNRTPFAKGSILRGCMG
jgi:hypothetical protein